jgi:hypothetical protein
MAAMRQVLAYRDRYQITDPVNPLGLEAGEGEGGDAHAIAARTLDSITTTSGTRTRPMARSGPRSMERVQVVLAEARASAERMRREADERAHLDRVERVRERASERSW